MSLAAGLPQLINEFISIHRSIESLRTAREQAIRKAAAIHTYVLTGKPMTRVTTFPGSITGNMTTGPVAGIGIGGIDVPVPNMGLDAALPGLISDLYNSWNHQNHLFTWDEQSVKEATAIHTFFSKALVRTIDTTRAPVHADNPSIVDIIYGTGGVLTNAPGPGYDAVHQQLVDELTRIWSEIDWQNPESIMHFAQEIGTAYYDFCKSGIVKTTCNFVAPDSVDDVGGGVGSYQTGQGASFNSQLY